LFVGLVIERECFRDIDEIAVDGREEEKRG
jgi:hypothetical protein